MQRQQRAAAGRRVCGGDAFLTLLLWCVQAEESGKGGKKGAKPKGGKGKRGDDSDEVRRGPAAALVCLRVSGLLTRSPG